MPIEDIIFTASLLARIFDDDLDLDVADAFEIFGALDLPTDVVPVRAPTRAQPMAPRSFVPSHEPRTVLPVPEISMPSLKPPPVAIPCPLGSPLQSVAV